MSEAMDLIPVAERPSCPLCGSNNAAQIEYGLRPSNPEYFFEEDFQPRVFGGCCVTGDDPMWRCRACGNSYGVYVVVVDEPSPTPYWLSLLELPLTVVFEAIDFATMTREFFWPTPCPY